MMTTQRETWDRYTKSWREKEVSEKKALFEASLESGCVYTDPLMRCEGWEELAAYMASFNEQFPGAYFHTVEFYAHHDRSAARWEMRGADEQVLDVGISYAEYTKDGRLAAMTGFFKPPAG